MSKDEKGSRSSISPRRDRSNDKYQSPDKSGDKHRNSDKRRKSSDKSEERHRKSSDERRKSKDKYRKSSDKSKEKYKRSNSSRKKKENYLVYMKVNDGSILRALAETLSKCHKRGCLIFKESGIYSDIKDQNGSLITKLTLDEDNFKYKYNHTEEELVFGADFQDLAKQLKGNKKKNNCILYIKDDTIPYKLNITEDKNNIGRPSKRGIKSIQLQPMECVPDDKYERSIPVETKDMQSFVKELKSTGVTGMLNMKVCPGKSICFRSSNDKVPEYEITDYEKIFGDDDDDIKYEYTQKISYLQLQPLLKISGLNSSLKLYTSKKKDSPLKIAIDVGSLGKLCIYIKPNVTKKKRDDSEDDEDDHHNRDYDLAD